MSSVEPYAGAWSRIAREVVGTPYPWAPGQLILGPDDALLVPEEVHPAFHGALDWHSCVHMLWSLATLVEGHAEALGEMEREAALALLRERLTGPALAVEVEHLRRHPGFERPYGWAWVVQLAARLGGSPVEELRALAPTLQPLTDCLAEAVPAWLAAQAYPVRHGKHQNDAFALTLMIDGYARLGRPDVVGVCRARALEWFADDREAPTGWEPGGTDFLSPALTEAVLMVEVLGPDRSEGGRTDPRTDEGEGQRVHEWLRAFLPGLGAGRHEHLLTVPEVRDGSDGQLVHLAGLALSRAWGLRRLAPWLPDDAAARVREGADRQEAAVRPFITEGDFMATHWLVSFALLAAGAALGRSGAPGGSVPPCP